jgi:hypothetical protein
MSLKTDIARKFLELVSHLHHRGYQQLRIVPYVRDGPAPIWACDLVPAAATRKDHGGLTPNFVHGPGFFSVRYVPNSPWPGFVEQSLDEAANYFLQQHLELAERTLGADVAYVRWYEEMLVATAPRGLVASELYWEEPPDHMYVLNVLNADTVYVPLPPPGAA